MVSGPGEHVGFGIADGGMHGGARSLQAAAEARGVTFQLGSDVERIITSSGRVAGVALANEEQIPADAVVFNGDVSALATGLLGERLKKAAPKISSTERSLSAITWCVSTPTSGFPLDFHNVFFGDDYANEFGSVFERRGVTAKPTVYICAQDRAPGATAVEQDRLLLLVNAPADGDLGHPDQDYIDGVQARAMAVLNASGLRLNLDEAVMTGPVQFHDLFPATGGALYGRANHSPFASFQRMGSERDVPGLSFAGSSVYPGEGVPMATMFGWLAA